MRGLFISLEGVDGVGKTTQLRLLAERLRGLGCDVVVAQEPGGTRVGLELRRLLLDRAASDLRPIPEMLLYFASRAQNIAEVIRPALDAGKIVLCDRFTDATLAYQGYGRGLGADAVRAVEAVACGGLEPDRTLWLDVDPAEAVRRALARDAGDKADQTRMEREDAAFFERVRRGYREIRGRAPERFRRVDASGGVDEAARAVWAEVEPLLKDR